MAITRPRDNLSATSGSATPACSFAALPAAGSCIVVGWASWKATAHTHNSMADNQGGTYTQIGSTLTINDNGGAGGANIRISLWKRDAISAPSGTFTVTATASATCDSRLVIAEYAGMAASTLDQTNQASGSGTTPTTTLATTTNPDDAIVGVLTSGAVGTVTMTEDATNLPTLIREDQDNSANQCINMAERIVSSTAAYTGNWAITSGPWACIVVALKGAAPLGGVGIDPGSPTWPFPHPPLRVA